MSSTGRAALASAVVAVALAGALLAWLSTNAHTSTAAAPEAPHSPLELPDSARANGLWSLPQGVAVGDVSSRGAVLWARAREPAQMWARIGRSRRLGSVRPRTLGVARAAEDYTVSARLRRLRPDARYFYRVWFSAPGSRTPVSQAVTGTFRTPPSPATARPVRFVFGADVGSSAYCRHERYGLPIFYYMSTVQPDFVVALGDMIYADSDCPVDGPADWRNVPGGFPEVDDTSVNWTNPAALRDVYFEHWRYYRADRHARYLFARAALYSTWDDHEAVNDFGASWAYWNSANRGRAGYPNLVAAARQALFSYGGIRRDAADPKRLYRSFRWGRDLHLILTDTRSYRSRNELPDTAESEKTLLGKEQLAWLKRTLRASGAAWKVVVSSVPVTVPNGSAEAGRDGWADGGSRNGFERELLDLLRWLDAGNVRNVVFLSGDVHFPQVTRSESDFDRDGDQFVFHELIAGPLNARTWAPYGVDGTTKPRILYSDRNLFNFGLVEVRRVGGRPRLVTETRDAFGKVRPGSRLVLRAG